MMKQNGCIDCEILISPKASRCRKCSFKIRSLPLRRFNISKEELEHLTQRYNLSEIGGMFGVSGNSIKDRCKYYNIDYNIKIIPDFKSCSKCKIEKPRLDFHFRDKKKNKINSKCKECQSKAGIIWRNKSGQRKIQNIKSLINIRRYIHNKRNFIINYLEKNPCSNCGNNDIRVLEFDHLNPLTKKYNISQMNSHNLDNIKLEIDKCQVLCRNCHLIKTKTNHSNNSYKKLTDKNKILIKKNFIDDLKKNSCCRFCGNSNSMVLEFDHIKEEKCFNISFAISSHKYSLNELINEISKCQILCGNCHIIKSLDSINSYKSLYYNQKNNE